MVDDIAGAVVDGMFQSGPAPEQGPGFFMDMLNTMPTMTATAGYKSFRGMNTITGGGFGSGVAHTDGMFRAGFKETNPFKPNRWGRYGGPEHFNVTGGLDSKKYNPFYMAGGVNSVGRGFEGVSKSKTLNRLSKTGMAERMRKRGFLSATPGSGDGELVSRGFTSRMTAGARVNMMSDAQFGRNAGNSYNFLRKGAGYTADQAQSVLKAGKGATAQAISMSGGGTVSGAFSALGNSMRHGSIDDSVQLTRGNRIGLKAADTIRERSGLAQGRSATLSNLRGPEASKAAQASRAARGLKTVGTAAKVSRFGYAAAAFGSSVATGPVGIAVGVAMTAWAVYDVAKMATKLPGHAMKLGIDAAKSFQGGMRVGIMEQGFRDNEVTMTSRARGVMAIQNSRMNARSVLGAEAGAMAAHFG